MFFKSCLHRPNFYNSNAKQSDSRPAVLRAPTKHRDRPNNEVERLETCLKQAENFLFSVSAQESRNYLRERWQEIEANARDQFWCMLRGNGVFFMAP